MGVAIGVFVADWDESLIAGWIDTTIVDATKPAMTDGETAIESSLGSVDERLDDITRVLENGYFYDNRIDENEMKQRAIKSYVDGLNDPFTVYLDAEENQELEQ
ncbi:MAG: hypothetical protein H6766_00790 [Candidatus Peribacteria bacterium]|nr:MAG: hypothetical protein H6766_00790 [Candidatus Peribacteria bacterium]